MKLLHSTLSSLRKKAFYSAGIVAVSAAGILASGTANACPSNPMVGGMCVFGGNYTIRGWAAAEGQILSISQFTAVFSLMGTTFGGDGRTSFGLPDLRGRAAVGVGNGPGLSDMRWGEKTGTEFVTLTVAQMPNHSHGASTTVDISVADADISVTSSLNAQSSIGTSTSASANVLAQNGGSFVYSSSAPTVEMASDSITANANATDNPNSTISVANNCGRNTHDNI
jgi:microcystin-dependent protein